MWESEYTGWSARRAGPAATAVEEIGRGSLRGRTLVAVRAAATTTAGQGRIR
jgi:hypothetical protein